MNSMNSLSLAAERSQGTPGREGAPADYKVIFDASLIPIINSFFAVGLVALPGMMTGQIMAGVEPVEAVKYQILIMFMIASCTAIGVGLLCLCCYLILSHPEHRIRWERIIERD